MNAPTTTSIADDKAPEAGAAPSRRTRQDLPAPVISIIIVSWNTRALVLDCLESLFADAREIPVEVFVVDNASSDDTVAAVSERFPSVRLICNAENLGFARANNIAITQAKGRYICLVNSDIVVRSGCFAGLIRYLDEHAEAGIAAPRLRNADLTLQRSCKSFPTLLNNFGPALGLDRLFPRSRSLADYYATRFDHDRTAAVDLVAGAFLMVRREAIESVGLLDERFFFYGEDTDWCKRVHDGGWTVVFDPAAEAIHREGKSSSRSPMRFYLESRRSRLRYWQKHRRAPAVAAIVAIMILHEGIRAIIFGGAFLLTAGLNRRSGYKALRSVRCLAWLAGLT